MNITSVVIIYNSALKDSDTLKSILRCQTENITLEICVWNNGPLLLNETDVSEFLSICQGKGIGVRIYQDTQNLSLSKIYNFFIKNEKFEFITILDQDSHLPTNFYTNIALHPDADIITPIIIAEKNGANIQTDPHIDGDINIMIDEGKVDVKIDSVMSGLALSQNGIDKIMLFRGYVFEERLAFYGIDSDFFRIINIMIDNKTPLNIYCSNRIYHSFAMFNIANRTNSFRIMELFYYKSFIRNEYQKKSKISTIYIYLRDFLRGKIEFYRMKNLLVFTINNMHPRSKIDLNKKTVPTHRIED
ncbi:glycosyltransferase family A protein [Brenneria rubrifaciens]|uniref:Glycosyltransferase family 2 protein n=1 Tax=Brenneria rubrifaciens TaxID=55213 RepID=A0A4P8QWA7_9GAMM|nr:glycosyltransferase family A protein [Brenneria rubrifaciens]QCR09779.1 glycosyltransferase family 2 protein [Brenneria rubrifaciens]